MSIPGATPFLHDGDTGVGVLLSHGFTGSTVSMHPWAEDLAAAGHSVALPLLPGHGTTWQEMNGTTWQDWYAELSRGYARLADTCEHIIVAGLSMGGALVTKLAQDHPDRIDGLVLVNPAYKVEDPRMRFLPILQRFLPSLPGIGNDIKKPGQDEGCYDKVPLRALFSQTQLWSEVIEAMPSLTLPVLLFRSPQDHIVPASSSALLLSRISSTDVHEELLLNSYHVATLDNDAPTIFAMTREFIDRLTS
ncbi:MAG: alpha/beta fold hydrolase [Actinomycetia bacterium]|nr:alpha/beta fold hydrolase [Actinomycetes bacterium]